MLFCFAGTCQWNEFTKYILDEFRSNESRHYETAVTWSRTVLYFEKYSRTKTNEWMG